jgi:putative methionine-R-sulfoxide reductase with GAF domain
VRSELSVPILHQDRPWGEIHVDSEYENAFTEEDVKLLGRFAGHFGIWLEEQESQKLRARRPA